MKSLKFAKGKSEGGCGRRRVLKPTVCGCGPRGRHGGGPRREKAQGLKGVAQAAKRPLSLPPGDHPSAGPAVSGQHDFAVYTGWAREAPFLFWLWFISQPALFSTIHLHQCVHLAEMGAEDEQQWASEQVKLVAFFSADHCSWTRWCMGVVENNGRAARSLNFEGAW